jgi:hypothetical protein
VRFFAHRNLGEGMSTKAETQPAAVLLQPGAGKMLPEGMSAAKRFVEYAPNNLSRITAALEQRDASWAAVVARVMKERDEALVDLLVTEQSHAAQLAMLVAALGGEVEGRPTHEGNYLQRVRELRDIVAKTPRGALGGEP